MEAKSNPHCFLCNSRVGVSNRNAVEIFNDQNKLPTSDKSLSTCIGDFTGKLIDRQTVHSLIICKKCFKLLQEYDDLDYRVNEIKNDLMSQFKKTLEKNSLDFHTYPNNETQIRIEKMNNPGVSKNIKREGRIEDNPKSSWIKNALIPDIKKISPMPSNVVIVGYKGKKLKLQNPPKNTSPAKSIVADGLSSFSSIGLNQSETIKDVLDDSFISKKAKKNTGSSSNSNIVTYLSEVDGIIVKTEKREMDKEEDLIFRELEIVDDGISDMPMGDGSHVFMEQAEDGSVIRVISSNNILQDEHGNYVYNAVDDDDMELILPEQTEDGQIYYKDIIKDTAGNLLKYSTSEKTTLCEVNGQIVKDETMENIDMDIEALSNVDSLESQAAAVKGSDNLYTCLICDAFESDKRSSKKKKDDDGDGNSIFLGDANTMLQHMKVMHKTDIFICDICGEVLLSRIVLEEHIAEHTRSVTGDYKCDLCMKCFETDDLLKRHQKFLHWRVKNYTCPICNRKFSSQRHLDEHAVMHKGNKPHLCSMCNKTFASKYTYHSHMKTHTQRPRPYKCNQCGKSFFTLPNLSQHEKTHLGIKNFICLICDKPFATQHNLEVHQVVHTGYKPFKCKTCGKCFARGAEIRDHERTHTGERPYFCDICDAKFSQRSNLQSHRRATHLNDKRYKCRQCDKSFKRRRLLEYHIKASHTGERPFSCSVCNATFVYPEHFKKHQRIHSGEKPYKCEVCGKAFNSRDNRNAHRYVHSDKKPYECLDCGAGFMRKPLLYAHMHSRGHLSDTIVVNQPRINNGDIESSEELKPQYIVESGKEDAKNIKDFENEIPILISSADQSQEDPKDMGKPENILIENSYLDDADNTIDEDSLAQRIEIIDGDHEFIQTEDGSIRLVQIKMADGENAWVALN